MRHNITPLQVKLLELLKWFDGYCKENKLRYYAIGGTALGAVRHQGFIPWDDDIDVGMPRRDFEKLRELSKNQEGRYKFETYDSEADDYCYAFHKLYDTTTTLIEHKRVDVIRGLYIDIFPLDGIGNTKDEGLDNYNRFKRLNQLFETEVNGVRKGRSFYKNAAVLLFKLLPSCILNQRALRIKMNDICAKYDFDECKYGGNFFGAYWEKEIVELSLFGKPTYYQFEDMMIACPEDADGYLTSIYNDWRKLPPVEKQVSHHEFTYLDLDKSYLKHK